MPLTIPFGDMHSDSVTDFNADIKEAKVKGHTMIYNQARGVYAKRTHMSITYNASININQIVDDSTSFYNYRCDVKIPEQSNNTDLVPRQFSYEINSNYNYRADIYKEFVADKFLFNLPNLYLQQSSSFNESIPDIFSFRNLGMTLTQDKFIRFNMFQDKYVDISSPRSRNLIFDYNHTFPENAAAEKYPLYNQIMFSYNNTKALFPLFGQISPDTTNNLFERIMLLAAHHPDTLGMYDLDGYPAFNMNILKQNYFGSYGGFLGVDDSNILYVSEDHHLHTVDWSHLYALDEIMSTLSTDNVFRHYDDMLFNNQKCESEYLFFKIEKFSPYEFGNVPLQTFVIPARQNFVSFIDTQIKHNQDCRYKVTGYCAIYGSEIVFDLINVSPAQTIAGTTAAASGFQQQQAQFFADVYPSVQIVAVPMFDSVAKVIETPPMKPIVSFHNENNSSNRIKIYLEIDKGSVEEDFIPIDISDSQQFTNVPPLLDGTYRFGYTRQPASFQLYRTTTKPKSYSDFSDKLIDTFANEDDSTSMIIYDYIDSGVKYYYMFRTLGFDNMMSNPSPVFEIEMIKRADDRKVNVNAINLNTDDDQNLQMSRNFRKMLQIFPSDIQTDIDPMIGVEDPFDIGLENIELGYQNDLNVWGRKFKLRVRSNDSGKTIDFNVKFNLIKKNSEEDFSG